MASNRYNGNVVPFADNATGSNRTVFGDTNLSDDINDNLNDDYKLGWEIVGINDSPTKQDFNALGYTQGKLISHLYQQGISEYNAAQEYYVNSLAMGSNGVVYQSLSGTEGSPNTGNNPIADDTNWKLQSGTGAYVIDTVDDFGIVPSGIDIVIVKDNNRGGTFIYDATQSAVNNGGTVFDGWVRQYIGAVNVKWFDGDVIAMENYGKESLGEGFSKFGDSKEGVWYRFGKNYELEGTVEKFETRPFLHDYRPTVADGADYNGDGGNLFIGPGSGNFTMKPDVNAIGSYMLHCSHNQGFGIQSLGKLTTGYKNVCYGTNTGRYLTEGYDNTASGRDAMHELTIGQKNCYYGRSSGLNQVDGNFNSAFGASSDQDRTTGNGNTVIGAYGGREFVDGNYNTLVGYYNSKDQTTGSENIGIGHQSISGNGITTGSKNTVIGGNFQGLPDVSRQLVIGNGNGEKFIYVDPVGGNSSYVLLPSSNIDTYNPDAIDGQVTSGATLVLRATAGSNYNVAQIAFQSRNGQPWNRIVSTGGTAPFMTFCTNNAERLRITQSGHLHPYVDNTQTLGSASNKFSVIYAGTGTINTSDDREKTYIDITDIERKVALELKANMKKFKFNDSISEKGEEKARIHFGASAQTVKSVFEKHGLIAEDYALLCYDEWETEYAEVIDRDEVLDDEGNVLEEATYKQGDIIKEAGNRYGIRYDELLCFIISAM